MISNAVESFWVWCYLNSIATVLKLHSHITVLWCFCRISLIYEFLFLGVGLKTKTRKSSKIFAFFFFSFQAISNGFLYIWFLVVDNAINWFFRDFRGFDLANVLDAIIEYALSTKRFEEPFFQWTREIFKQGYELAHLVFIAIVTCLFFC